MPRRRLTCVKFSHVGIKHDVRLNRWYAALTGTSANFILPAAGPLFLMTKHGQLLILCACHARNGCWPSQPPAQSDHVEVPMNKLPYCAHKKDVFFDEFRDRIIEAGEGASA